MGYGTSKVRVKGLGFILNLSSSGACSLELYTRFPSPILHGVWHKKEGSVGGAYLAQWA